MRVLACRITALVNLLNVLEGLLFVIPDVRENEVTLFDRLGVEKEVECEGVRVEKPHGGAKVMRRNTFIVGSGTQRR
ncbi:hypothetical protein C8Q74DRAFT_1308705 [Fomes fomentarius]|nr:hypothetical protein C8Q74DRAFT_1308705 [Fomes fomentarius]